MKCGKKIFVPEIFLEVEAQRVEYQGISLCNIEGFEQVRFS